MSRASARTIYHVAPDATGESRSVGQNALSPQQLVDDVAGHLRRLGARPEAGVEAELARQLVIDARPAEEEQQVALVAPPRQLDQLRRVLDVQIALGHDL